MRSFFNMAAKTIPHFWSRKNQFFTASTPIQLKTCIAAAPLLFFTSTTRRTRKNHDDLSMPNVKTIKAICVYISANNNNDEKAIKATKCLGKELASRGITLIYDGSRSGLMGVLADAVLANKGSVVGVMTKNIFGYFDGHPNLTKTIIVDSIKEQSIQMLALSDGIIAGPGGLGTLSKLESNSKPIGILNTDGCYDNFEFTNKPIVKSAVVHHDSTLLLDKMIDTASKKVIVKADKIESMALPFRIK